MGIWDQLNTKTIADNPASEIQTQSNPVHLQDSNRLELQDIKLINDATMRNGSPIVGTMVMQETTVTDNTGTAMLTCPKGQVLQVLNYGVQSCGIHWIIDVYRIYGSKRGRGNIGTGWNQNIVLSKRGSYTSHQLRCRLQGPITSDHR